MARKRLTPAPQSRRGTILLPVVLLAMALAGGALAYSTTVGASHRAKMRAMREFRLQLTAEAALSIALVELRSGGDGVVGSAQDPVGFGGMGYYTEVTALGADRYSLVAIGVKGREQCALEALVEEDASESRAAAVFAYERVSLASNVAVDSYDPAEGTYASQASRHGSVTLANANGHVLTNGSIEVASNATVYGDARWGPDAGDSLTSSGWVEGETAALSTALTIDVPETPAGASSGPLTVAARARRVVGPGTVVLDDVLVEGRGQLVLAGPLDVVMDSFELESRGTFTVDATGGPVRIFCTGEFALRSNGTVAVSAEDATEVTLICTAVQDEEDDCDAPLEFRSNGSWVGRILAPDALVDISSNFVVFGAIEARWVHLSSNVALHYDERLADGDMGSAESTWTLLGTRALSNAQLAELRAGDGTP